MVIPVGEGDRAWEKLLPDLVLLSPDDEILLVSKTSLQNALKKLLEKFPLDCPVRCVYSEVGRARQMNAGAKEAKKTYLWFLHCDSRLQPSLVLRLRSILRPQIVFFFALKFLPDGPALTKLNEVGVSLRSRLLQLPFGDQGFILEKKLFQKLGRFKENAPYGEDHLLIWKAHQGGVRVQFLGLTLYTSARKYRRAWTNVDRSFGHTGVSQPVEPANWTHHPRARSQSVRRYDRRLAGGRLGLGNGKRGGSGRAHLLRLLRERIRRCTMGDRPEIRSRNDNELRHMRNHSLQPGPNLPKLGSAGQCNRHYLDCVVRRQRSGRVRSERSSIKGFVCLAASQRSRGYGGGRH